MRFAPIVIALLACSSSFAEPAPCVDPVDSCVAVIRRDGSGSGTVVHAENGQSLILTCKHVCPDNAKVWVVAGVHGKQTRITAHYLKSTSNYDLALLVADAELVPVSISDTSPTVGDTVTHYGRASGPQSGKISQIKQYANRTIDVQSELLVVNGDSGSAIFNSYGQLCGVQHGYEIRKDDSENSLSCQVSVVREFVNKAIADRKIVK